MNKLLCHIDKNWKHFLRDEFSADYFQKIETYLENEINTVFPPKELIFNAFNSCPLKEVKVVLLGQDPYHGLGQAHGLSFSVPDGMKTPPSLRNILKEIHLEYKTIFEQPTNLEHWAKQGVLLLNASLTVAEKQANSHAKIGWQTFTDNVIQKISQEKEHLVFILWGAFAQKKKALIEGDHLILEGPHPSPFSAHRGFFGCNHFRECNDWLNNKNLSKINWEFTNDSST